MSLPVWLDRDSFLHCDCWTRRTLQDCNTTLAVQKHLSTTRATFDKEHHKHYYLTEAATVTASKRKKIRSLELSDVSGIVFGIDHFRKKRGLLGKRGNQSRYRCG